MNTLQDVIAYLKTDRLKHIVHLKLLEAYRNHLRWYYEEVDQQPAILLLIPTAAIPFDAHRYPDTAFVVLLAAASSAAADRIVASIPKQHNLVFKLVDDLTKEAVLQTFPAKRVTAFHAYTTAAFSSPPDDAVILSDRLDERLLPCYRENGYTLDEIQQAFQGGSTSFSIFGDDDPLSTCFTFINYENIWEIGGVYTVPAFRRQGLAKKVVSAALVDLLHKGRIPRYQVIETNQASRDLAESLGMKPFVVTEHFVYQPINNRLILQ